MRLSNIALAVSAQYGGLFKPSSLFTTDVNGAWYDPSDFSTMFQDVAGTKPVTAVEQPVGLMLDKSKEHVLGPELVTNGTFDSNVNGWTPQVSVTASRDTSIFPSGALKIQVTSAGGSTYVEQSLGSNFIVGRAYKATATVYTASSTPSIAGAAISFVSGSFTGATSVAQSQKDIAQTLTIYFTATSTTHSIYLTICTLDFMSWGSVGSVAYFDNISVRELSGNRAFNPSGNSANFPVLSARYNLLTKTEQLSDAVWSKQNLSVAEVAGAGPDGTAASLLTENSASACHLVDSASNTVSAGDYSVVAYLKPNGRTLPLIQIKGVTPEGNATFNLTGSGSVQAQSNATASIEPASNGFYKCTVNVTATAGGSAYLRVFLDSNTYQGDGVKGLYVWHPDLRVANDALNQPAYQRVNTATDYDTVGFKPYLSFNGVNQWLQTNGINFTYGDKMFVSAGVRRLIDSVGVICELSANCNNYSGSFLCLGGSNPAGTGNAFASCSRGTSPASADQFGYTQSAFAPPVTAVVSATHDIAGSLTVVYGNGTAGANGTGSKGIGNFGNYPLYIGARNGSSLWFNGRLYGLVVAGKAASASEIASTEAWLNQKTGAY